MTDRDLLGADRFDSGGGRRRGWGGVRAGQWLESGVGRGAGERLESGVGGGAGERLESGVGTGEGLQTGRRRSRGVRPSGSGSARYERSCGCRGDAGDDGLDRGALPGDELACERLVEDDRASFGADDDVAVAPVTGRSGEGQLRSGQQERVGRGQFRVLPADVAEAELPPRRGATEVGARGDDLDPTASRGGREEDREGAAVPRDELRLAGLVPRLHHDVVRLELLRARRHERIGWHGRHRGFGGGRVCGGSRCRERQRGEQQRERAREYRPRFTELLTLRCLSSTNEWYARPTPPRKSRSAALRQGCRTRSAVDH